MPETYKLKQGTVSNITWRYLGNMNEAHDNLTAFNAISPTVINFFQSHRDIWEGSTGILIPTIPSDFIEFWENNSSFRSFFADVIYESLGRYSLLEGDSLNFDDDGNNGQIYKYMDIRTVTKFTYKGEPVYRFKQNNNIVYQKQAGGGMTALMGLSNRTFTSITWNIFNRDREFANNIYANATTGNYPTEASLYTSGSHPTGTLNNLFLRATGLATNSSTQWIQSGLNGNTIYYGRIITSVPGKAIINSESGIASASTLNGAQAVFVSATTSSITFRLFNYTSSTFTHIYAGTTSPGTIQVGTNLAAGDNFTYTLPGLSANTSYNIYVRGYNGTTYTTTTPAFFTASTLVPYYAPNVTSANGLTCQGPTLSIYNQNNFEVTLYWGNASTQTNNAGTIAAGGTLSNYTFNMGLSAGNSYSIYLKFYNATKGYSSVTNQTGTISKFCIG